MRTIHSPGFPLERLTEIFPIHSSVSRNPYCNCMLDNIVKAASIGPEANLVSAWMMDKHCIAATMG